MESVVNALRQLLLVLQWIFFMPFYESFISMFHCTDGTHYFMKSMNCFEGEHVVLCVFAGIGLVFLLSLSAIIALLYNETQPIKEDSLSRLESTFEIMMIFLRIVIGTLALICNDSFCSWIILVIFCISSAFYVYQYFLYIPYYNQFVSVYFGSLVNIFAWVTINCVMTKFADTNGHIVIILIGIPLVAYLTKFLRQKRVEQLMNSNIDKINSDIDALIQITMIKDLSISKIGNKTVGGTASQEMIVKGSINLHLEECKSDTCICKNLDELYDVGAQDFLAVSKEDLHNEPIFIHHYNKKMYEDALNKFINSPNLHISFSFYLFQVMKNIHAALHELQVASKKKPTIQQQFTIFRYKHIIEQHNVKEELKNKHIYQQLTNVKEFERLNSEMQKQIENVCNFQVEFWTHLTTVVPDLNILNDISNKIYQASKMSDLYWGKLSEINPNYSPSLTLYGEYLSFIKNHPQIGKGYLERALANNTAHNSMDENIKRSEILFSEDSTVIHISGNKDSSGRILKVSQGLNKCFGYNKTEVNGHNINFLMPNIIGIRHNDFLDKFYKTGRQRVFNVERVVFALNRQGHCFRSKVLVKILPSLKEGVQYVGMIRPVFSEHDYIITDLSGNIDSFSKGVTSLLGLNPVLFKENTDINIQMLCPELIEVFEQRRKLIKLASEIKKSSMNQTQEEKKVEVEQVKILPETAFQNSKLAQPGGGFIAIIVPQNFAALAKSEKTAKQRGNSKKKNGGQEADMIGGVKVTRSPIFREFMKYLSKGRTYVKKCPDLKKLLSSKEYKDNEKFKVIQCELDLMQHRINRSDSHQLQFLVFKISKSQSKKDEVAENDAGESQDNEQDQNQQLKNASFVVQEVFGVKDDQTGLLKQGTVNIQSQLMQRAFTNQEFNTSQVRKTLKDDPIQNQIDMRRQDFQQSGLKKVGFADDVSAQMSSVKQRRLSRHHPKILANAAPDILQPMITFLDASRDAASFSASDRQILSKREAGAPLGTSFEDKNKDSLDLSKSKETKFQMLQKEEQKKLPSNNLKPEVKKVQQEDKETPRIDVKKDISISEKTKQKTQTLNDQITQKKQSTMMAGSKPNTISQVSTPQEQSRELSKESGMLGLKQQSIKVAQPLQKEKEQLIPKDKAKSSQNSSVDGSIFMGEEFEEEIEEIIEEIDEEAEDDMNYGDEDQQDIGSSSPLQALTKSNMGMTQDNYGNFIQPVPLVKKKKFRDYDKIVTNPKYKNFDIESCGSAYFKDWDFTNDEIDIRELIKKSENRKQRRDRRRKRQLISVEEEQKKNQEEMQAVIQAKKNFKDDNNPEDEDKASEEGEPDEQNEEDKKEEDEQSQESENEGNATTRMLQEELDQGEVSSIASSIFSQTRSYFSLRNSIEEKFIPRAIKNLRIIANILFVSLLILYIAWFAIQLNLFSKILDNIYNIRYSEQRINDIIDINLRIQNLRFDNENILDASRFFFNKTRDQFRIGQNQLLLDSSTSLKNSQTLLSLRTAGLQSSVLKQVNPEDVILQYEAVLNLPSQVMVNIWESIIKIVVNTYQLADEPLTIITRNPMVTFVQDNCLNPILSALKESTQAIMSETNSYSDTNANIFLFLLIAVSCSLVISVSFLLPVIIRAKRSKQDVLKLFLLKKVEKSIDEQLKMCRSFITRHQVAQDNINAVANGNDNEMEDNLAGMNEQELKKEKEELYSMKKNKKAKKKWKKLRINFTMIGVRIVLIVAILEVFFLINYLFSRQFLNEVSSLTDELKLLISRQPQFTQILLAQKEIFYTNGNSTITGVNVRELVLSLNDQIIEQQQSLLEIFSSNTGYHTQEYITDFKNLMFSNMCEHLAFNDSTKAQCESFNDGILKKGMYSTITRYLSSLRRVGNRFDLARLPNETIREFINDINTVNSERTCDLYMRQLHKHLEIIIMDEIDTLQACILNFIALKTKINWILPFSQCIWDTCYSSTYLFGGYSFKLQWKSYGELSLCLGNIQYLIFSVLPVEICFKIEEIRAFIYKNSTTSNQMQ